MKKIHSRDSKGEKEVGSFESGQQECSTSKEQHISYSKIREGRGGEREISARREEHQIDYTDITFCTVYV